MNSISSTRKRSKYYDSNLQEKIQDESSHKEGKFQLMKGFMNDDDEIAIKKRKKREY